MRTFLLVCIGDLFFRAASVGDAFAMLGRAVSVWNPSVLWNGALFGLGLDWIEVMIAGLSLLLLLAVSLLQQKGSVRDKIGGQMGALVRFAVCGDTVRVLRAGIQRRGVYLPGILMAAFVGVLYGKERKYMVECVKISR